MRRRVSAEHPFPDGFTASAADDRSFKDTRRAGQRRPCRTAPSGGAGPGRDESTGRNGREARPMQGSLAEQYWTRTRGLMVFCMVVWFVFSFGIHFFVRELNQIVILGFPLGFYMAAQGSLIVFVVLIFWFSAAQNRIDEESGMAEDE
jgi:putative solute:sodium symporter small subunit